MLFDPCKKCIVKACCVSSCCLKNEHGDTKQKLAGFLLLGIPALAVMVMTIDLLLLLFH